MLRAISLTALLLAVSGMPAAHPASTAPRETAVLAGGCFWCLEADFEKLEGVRQAVSGYAGGHVKNPTYAQVSRGGSGHLEVIQVTYDPAVISYAQILRHFWRNIDPTRNDGQFCDRGPQYRPAILYRGAAQQRVAIASLERMQAAKPFPDPLKVELIALDAFYPAEDYHQDYARKNPLRYRFYRFTCGRDARLDALWGDD